MTIEKSYEFILSFYIGVFDSEQKQNIKLQFLKDYISADSILHFFNFPIQFEIENRKSSTPHKYSRIYNKNTIVVQPILGRIPMMFSSGGAYGIRTRDPNTASVVRSQLR